MGGAARPGPAGPLPPRGHDRSGWAGRVRVTSWRLGRDLGEVVDRGARRDPVVLVGHLLGGMAVLALAGSRPELFDSRSIGVALLSILAAPLPSAGQDADGPLVRLPTGLAPLAAWALWLASSLLQELDPFRLGPVRRLLRRRSFAGDPCENAVRPVTESWITTPTTVMSAHLPGLARYGRRAAVDAVRNVPVLVLAGTEDVTIPADPPPERLARRIGRGAPLVPATGAGHMLALTQAEAVTSACSTCWPVLGCDRPTDGHRDAPGSTVGASSAVLLVPVRGLERPRLCGGGAAGAGARPAQPGPRASAGRTLSMMPSSSST